LFSETFTDWRKKKCKPADILYEAICLFLIAVPLRATIDGLASAGPSLRKIAAQLNDMGGGNTPRKAQ